MGRLESGQERFFYDFCLDEVVPTDPECPDIAFGLCDLGMGFPELGSVSISEIQSVRGNLGLPIERDKYFEATHPLRTGPLRSYVYIAAGVSFPLQAHIRQLKKYVRNAPPFLTLCFALSAGSSGSALLYVRSAPDTTH